MKRQLIFLIICIFHSSFILPQSKIKTDNSNEISLQKEGTDSIICYRPLDIINISLSEPASSILVRDGAGKVYYQGGSGSNFSFRAGGAIGRHSVQAFDKKGRLLEEKSFMTNAKTGIHDESGDYEKFLKTLYWTMVGEWGETEIWRINDQFYYTFVRWLRDHVHTLKGMKYFYPELKSGIDLYAATQRQDGMIWDNIYPRGKEKNWWNRRFDYGNFINEIEGGKYEMKRIPIENDVEYLFLEGLYFTWKATGDDVWMASHLDEALKAIHYSMTDPYRWSEKYNLLKRGYTIDTWDFQSNEDAALVDGNDIMRIELGKTRFGIMFGDNTGMAMGCRYLAEMLKQAHRDDESMKIRTLGDEISARIENLSWNGSYYKHHVPEDPSLRRDLGVDEDKQISLSNAYSLNRGISHENAVSIIKSYLKLREIMPSSSPGEWYTIYPPFEKGFGDNDASKKWQYMNGGVTPIVAGELAHGAFENGYEKYGVDILERLMHLASLTGDYLHCTYAGKMPDKPVRNFTVMDISEYTNTVYPSQGSLLNDKTISYQENGTPSKNKIFSDIPFNILDPLINKFSSIGISSDQNFKKSVTMPVNQKAASIYIMHGTLKIGLMGSFTIQYSDGTDFTEYIDETKIGFWWDDPNEGRPKDGNTIKAWRSNNSFYEAAYIHGINNPYPDKIIKSVELSSMQNNLIWQIMGITLSDYPVYFEPSIISWGIPDNWGSAAVVYALIEGLAGIKDSGVAFNIADLSPRWAATGVKEVKVTAKYEASGGYISYQYKYDTIKNSINVLFTGNSDIINFQLLLPEGKTVGKMMINGKEVSVVLSKVENSLYANYKTQSVGVNETEILFK